MNELEILIIATLLSSSSSIIHDSSTSWVATVGNLEVLLLLFIKLFLVLWIEGVSEVRLIHIIFSCCLTLFFPIFHACLEG